MPYWDLFFRLACVCLAKKVEGWVRRGIEIWWGGSAENLCNVIRRAKICDASVGRV